jgi:hypothetical protein
LRIYIATILLPEDTIILGAYSTEDLALGRIEREMDQRIQDNEEYGAYPMVVDTELDDVDIYT